ncbi:hypothetical protein [Myxococcus phage Mx1]|nr:hypothetical protein [Myxococcus phage Mx1]
MKIFTYLLGAFIGILYFLVLIPFLISAASDAAVVLGFILLIGGAVAAGSAIVAILRKEFPHLFPS